MTATGTRPPPARTPGPSSPSGAPRRPRTGAGPAAGGLPLACRRTLVALLASALGVVPLKSLFSDYGWLVDVWLTAVVVVAPAAFLRLRRQPAALDIWPGLILLVPWLTLRFVPHHAVLGLIPTRGTWSDVSALLTDLHHTTRNEVAPVHTTVAVRLVVCALVGLLAALVDLIAVVGRRGALAGVPLLVVYTIAGAVPRRPVSWVWFVVAALAYLLLLGLDSGEDLQRWGRRISVGGGRRRTALQVSTPRIAVAAIVVAVVLPLLVPGQSRNLIANALHDSNGGVGGFGAGGGTSITPFVALKGELDRTTPKQLATVHMQSHSSVSPYNLRVNVLDDYTGDGWQVGDHGSTQNVDQTLYPTLPADPSVAVRTSTQIASVTVTKLTGNVPVFSVPTAIGGLSNGTTWAPQDQVLLGTGASPNERYLENFQQPDPTIAQLQAATGPTPSALSSLLDLPSDLPSSVRDLVTRLTRGAATPYAKARALTDYFTDGKHGFVYDLKTRPGDSGSVLVDFLKSKHGYCQQYAASLGVMLRAAGIPSRVVLGYMHQAPDSQGDFTISTNEAHAWVEGYFSGLGWVPFDPTPASGLVGGAKTDLVWAPHDYPKGDGEPAANNNPGAAKSAQPSSSPTSSAPSTVTTPTQQAHAAGARSSAASWWWLPLGAGLLLVLALPLLPAVVRARRRRRRYVAGRTDADALWAELSDTAVDLGYVWSPARSPRQVARWLTRDAADSAESLQALAAAVEQERYCPPTAGRAAEQATLPGRLRDVTSELRANRSRGARFRARFWPASLGWKARLAQSVRRNPFG